MENLVKDFKISSVLEKLMCFLIFTSLIFLVVGLMTSISIPTMFHVFIIIPALYFIPKANYKNYPKSAWAFLALSIVMVTSIFLNQDIISDVARNLGKTKYFFLGFLSIAPLSWYFKNHITRKKISILLYLMFSMAAIATIAGLIGKFFGINPITQKVPAILTRNSGIVGSTIDYAHNISYILIANLAFFFYKDKKIINKFFLITVFIINLVGFYFSYTRGAWLAFFVAIPFMMIKKCEFKKVILSGVMCFFLLIGAYSIADNSMERSDGDQTRVGLWKASLYAFKERPLLGFGYLNFENHSVELKKKYDLVYPEFRGSSHNDFMEVLSTLGILGFLCFISWIVFWAIDALKKNNFISIHSFAFLILFLISGLTQSTLTGALHVHCLVSFYIMLIVLGTNQIRLEK